MSLVSHLKQHLQGVGAQQAVVPSETTSPRAAATAKLLPAFLKQDPQATPRALYKQTSAGLKPSFSTIRRSPSTQRREDAHLSGLRVSVLPPRLHANDVRVELTHDGAHAATATPRDALNTAPPRPPAPGCEARGHVPMVHAAADGGFARPFLRQQVQRPFGRDTAPEVIHDGHRVASEFEPVWNEDMAL